MSALKILPVIFYELLTRNETPRVPEPDLIMDDPDKVTAFANSGTLNNALGMTYLLYAAHISSLIKPKDIILDLGCGPGTLLCLMARLYPESQFIGLDLSTTMLLKAEVQIKRLGLKNMELQQADITHLTSISNHSMDVVYSSLVIHHLPTFQHFEKMLVEIQRVLKPDGGIYLTDYGHLKHPKSIETMAHLHENQQPKILTVDYFNSLKAAFSVQEWKSLQQKYFCLNSHFYATPLLPIGLFIKSKDRNLSRDYCKDLNKMLKCLDPSLQKDFQFLLKLTRWSGLKDNCFT